MLCVHRVSMIHWIYWNKNTNTHTTTVNDDCFIVTAHKITHTAFDLIIWKPNWIPFSPSIQSSFHANGVYVCVIHSVYTHTRTHCVHAFCPIPFTNTCQQGKKEKSRNPQWITNKNRSSPCRRRHRHHYRHRRPTHRCFCWFCCCYCYCWACVFMHAFIAT